MPEDRSPLSALKSALGLTRRLITLERDLVLFDLEATGVDVATARIIEIALVRLTPAGKMYGYEKLVNPASSIPEEVQEITGITNEMVAGAPFFGEIADAVNAHFASADVVGYNVVRYDLPLLSNEMERCSRELGGPTDRQVLDAYQLFRRRERHTLERAYTYYTGKSFRQSHRAMDDVAATAEVLTNQLVRYGLTGTPMQIAGAISHPYLDADGKLKQDGEQVVICFGKYRGRSVREVWERDPGYVRWMAREFNDEVASIVRTELFNKSILSCQSGGNTSRTGQS